MGKHSAELPNDKVASHTKRMCITFQKDEIKAKLVLRKRYQKSSDFFSFFIIKRCRGSKSISISCLNSFLLECSPGFQPWPGHVCLG